MNKKFGFTLAEVLITLGIIGVVAAMTIPTLIANTNSAKFRSQFKKSISTLNQAGLMAEAQFDINYSTNDPATATSCTISDNPNAQPPSYTFCAIFNGVLAGHTLVSYTDLSNNYTVVNKDGGTPAANTPIPKDQGQAVGLVPNAATTMYVKLADGSMLAFNNQAKGCSKDIGVQIDETWVKDHNSCIGFIDVNGVTMPNKEVTCATATDTTIGSGTCDVPNDANHMTDIYPIAFHDATVEPLTNAARYVLTTSK